MLSQQEAVGGLSIAVTAAGVAAGSIVYQPNGRIADAAVPLRIELASTVQSDLKRCIKIASAGVPSTTAGACQ